eukprot:TRINITY_DN77137_c0_g1_i1.p1 TRINITY_DN77137_c0_g1~~TRINITY_DN77137_c0_g1_i1.p1  ORF type:complete len:350 (-),score=56.02 TRINITY_DN77137_c0_g1_i1:59-1054(-)
MVTKAKLLAGAWGTAATVAGFTTYRRQRDFEERAPGVRDALSIVRNAVGNADLQLKRWPLRTTKVDVNAGHASAHFVVQGKDDAALQVLMTARRRRSDEQLSIDELDELNEPVSGGGWRAILSRPWELKLRVTEWLQQPKESAGASGGPDNMAEIWDLDSLVILPSSQPGDTALQGPTVLMGDARSIPDFETICVRRDSATKDDSSRRRLHRVFAFVTGAAVLAGCFRIVKSMGVSRSYDYARRAVLGHGTVKNYFGASTRVQTSSGTFGTNYINSRLRLVNEAGVAGDVEFTALREKVANDPAGRRGGWRVSLARLHMGGRAQNLEKSLF